jgi:hypothetical protein
MWVGVHRTRGLQVMLLVLALGVVSNGGHASAAGSDCVVENLTHPGATRADLQDAIFAASSGDTIEVTGVCVGHLDINESLQLVGNATPASPVPTLDGGGLSRVLTIRGAKVDVTLTDLTVTNGVSSFGSGGGINLRSSTLTLRGSTAVAGNSAVDPGGYAFGGGIYNQLGDLILRGHSSVSGNNGRNGGGVMTVDGTLSLKGHSLVSGNSGYGIGLMSFHHPVTAELHDSSRVTGNSGVGVSVSSGTTLFMSDSSSITGNTSPGSGGGLYIGANGIARLTDSSQVSGNVASDHGGGIFNSGVVSLAGSSLVTENTSARRGGGIFNAGGTVHLRDSSAVTKNTPDNCVRCG